MRKGSKPRNIWVGIKFREDLFSILNNAKLLSSNIRVSNDKTRLQMSGLTEAYDLVNKHNEEHPDGKLKVKHIKTVPTLIDATGKRRYPKNPENFLELRFSFYYQNVRSIKSENKFLASKSNLSLSAVPIDVIILTEICLSDEN